MRRSLFSPTIIVGVALIHAAAAHDARAETTNYDRSDWQIRAEIDRHLSTAEALLDLVLKADGARTVANTLVPINEMYMQLDAGAQMVELFAQAHPDPAVRKMADEGERKISNFLTELGLNRAMYDACKAVDVSGADSDTQRLMFKTLRDFRRAGVDRDEPTRARIKALREDIVKIGQAFGKNIREGVRSIKLDSPSYLEGLPEDYIASHKPGPDGKITITTDYPDYNPFMSYARNAKARLAIYKEFRRRGYPANISVLDELLAKRHELAKALGYDHWAHYITEDKMIGDADAVDQFINKIAGLAKAPADADMAMLLKAKRRDDPAAKRVSDDEKTYYQERVKATAFNFDSQEARPYFEFNRVQQGLFDVTGKLFGIQFRPAKDVTLWHQDVTAWDIYDGAKHIGRFMLDLHPRDGKYKHAACFGYQTGIKGKRIPISVLVCNFPNPRTSQGPALMEHSDVKTFFHEFGHLLHALLAGHHDWIDISGISTEWDFVEAPSQMLEEWPWDTKTLQMFAKHHETGEPIPAELVERMRAARDFGKGMWVSQQMFYAAISLNLHNRGPAGLDTTEKIKELTVKYAPCDYVPDTYMHCAFGHLNGYSAIYYTYMWSMVIAKDLFSEFAKAGMFDEAVAKRYRRCILEAGGAKPAAELVRDFLGRDYGFKAYGNWLGGSGGPAS